MKYEELFEIEGVEDSRVELSKDEIRQLMYEQARLERSAKKAKFQLLSLLSDPGDTKKTVELTTKAVRSILGSEITRENKEEEPYKDFSDEDKAFFDKRKYNPVQKLHESVATDTEVSDALAILRGEKVYDARKQRHKKKPKDYVDGVASFKLIFDLQKRQKDQEERLALLTLEVQRNKDFANDRFEQVGTELLQQKKLNALLVLGIAPKKLEVYKMILDNPELTIDEISSASGKSRATVFRWLKEIRGVENDTRVSFFDKVS